MKPLDADAEAVVADALGAAGYRGVWVHTMSQANGTTIIVVFREAYRESRDCRRSADPNPLSEENAVSIWGRIKGGLKRAGQVLGGVVGQPAGTVVDGAENRGPGQDDDAGTDKGHDA